MLLCEDLYLGAKHHHDKLKQKRVWCYDSFCGSLKQFYILEEEEIFSCFSCVVLFVPNISSTAAFALCTPCDHKNKLKTNKQYTVYCTEEKYSRLPVLVSQNARIYYTSTTFFVKLHEREQPQFLEAEWPLSMCSCSLLMKLLLSIS